MAFSMWGGRATWDRAGKTSSTGAGSSLQWLISDHLGTPRMIIDQTGTLANMKRHDYLPFGEELFAGIGGRTTSLGYTAGDGVRQQFTSKERDFETGLDYFLARSYSSTQGRFTSPDEFTGGPDELYYFADDASENPTFYADLRNPQSLNKYQYAYGNPLRFVDPDGHEPEPDPEPQDPCGCTPTKKQVGELQRDLEKLDEATSKPLFPITDTIGTSTPPTIGPVALPNDATVAPVPTVQPNQMARPIDKPKDQGHRKKHKKDHDRHTNPRPGDKKPPGYRFDRKPKPKPKQKPKPEPPKPKPTPKPEIGPDGKPVKPPEE
jgi:RHS repeat-associated protein